MKTIILNTTSNGNLKSEILAEKKLLQQKLGKLNYRLE